MSRFDFLKKTDQLLGIPACFFLATIYKVFHPFRKPQCLPIKFTNPPQRILVLKFFGLGSITLISGLLRNIRQQYPNTELVFLTFKSNANFIERFNLNIVIRSIDMKTPLTIFYSTLKQLLFFRRYKPDVAIDLEFFSGYSTFMAFLSGAKWRLGFHLSSFWRKTLINTPVLFNLNRHILINYQAFCEAMSLKVDDISPSRINVTEEEITMIDTLLSSKTPDSSYQIIAININASDLAPCRKWGREKFATTINQMLKEDEKAVIFLTGTLDEKQYVDLLLDYIDPTVYKRVHSLVGQISLLEFVALLNRVTCFITNDSGPMHFAVAQKVPCISIWGPGSPNFYGALNQEWHKTLYRPAQCSPCLYVYRTNPGYFCHQHADCLKTILPSDVVNAFKALKESL